MVIFIYFISLVKCKTRAIQLEKNAANQKSTCVDVEGDEWTNIDSDESIFLILFLL